MVWYLVKNRDKSTSYLYLVSQHPPYILFPVRFPMKILQSFLTVLSTLSWRGTILHQTASNWMDHNNGTIPDRNRKLTVRNISQDQYLFDHTNDVI